MKVFVFVGRNRPENEWDGVLSKLGVDYHKFRDPDNTWYQQDHWSELFRLWFKKKVPQIFRSVRVWAVGLLFYFQSIINSKKIIAFSPQASIIPSEMIEMGGKKNIKWASNLQSMGYPGKRLPISDGRAKLYYGTHKKKTLHIGDARHQELAESLGYSCINVDTTDHNVAGYLHEKGELIDILKNALDEIAADSKTI